MIVFVLAFIGCALLVLGICRAAKLSDEGEMRKWRRYLSERERPD